MGAINFVLREPDFSRAIGTAFFKCYPSYFRGSTLRNGGVNANRNRGGSTTGIYIEITGIAEIYLWYCSIRQSGLISTG